MEAGILTLDDFDFRQKTVLLRVDINSPIDHQTGGLADDNRLRKSVAAAGRCGVRERMGYVCTSGGGMVRFLSGQELPVVEALRRAARRVRKAR